MNSNYSYVLEYLQLLVGQPISYAYKSSDLDLYDFGFGETIERINRYGETRCVCSFAVHATCRIKLIYRPNGITKCVERFYEDTLREVFSAGIQCVLNRKIKRVGLSDKNDLWLDTGDYWIVFATFEDNEESWRFFAPDGESPHLVASNAWIVFE